MKLMLEYVHKDSFIHELTGATKLLCFLLWCITTMITYDTRILIFMITISIVLFKISKINFQEVAFVILFMYSF